MIEFIFEIIFEFLFLPIFESTPSGGSKSYFFTHAFFRTIIYLLLIAGCTWVLLISFEKNEFLLSGLFAVLPIVLGYCLYRSSVNSIQNYMETFKKGKIH